MGGTGSGRAREIQEAARELAEAERGRALVETWAKFILDHGPWDICGHHTFLEDLHPEAADKRFRAWVSEVTPMVGVPLRIVRGTERQRRGAIHYHSVLDLGIRRQGSRWLVDELQGLNLAMRRAWEKCAGGIGRFKPATSRGIYYSVKYVAKGGDVEALGEWDEPLDEVARKLLAIPALRKSLLVMAVGWQTAETIATAISAFPGEIVS